MNKAFQYIQRGDITVFYIINNRVKCRLLDLVMPLITHLGSAAFTIAFAVTALVLDKSSQQNFSWNIGLSLAFSHLLIHIIKKIVNRPRPNITLTKVNTFSISLYDYSFPSGHTTAAFSIAASIAAAFPEIGGCVLGLASLVGVSRIYLGVHYPTDVLIGAFIGTISAYYINGFMLTM